VGCSQLFPLLWDHSGLLLKWEQAGDAIAQALQGATAAMRRWVSSPSYKSAITTLVKARHQAGKTQREVATMIGKPPSFVAKVETGERRLDFVEFIVLARALGNDPATLLGEIAGELGGRVEI
jgi:hypothetical protein